MGKPGKDMEPLSTQTTAEKAQYIFRRAERLGWTRSKFLMRLLDWWFRQGAPAIDEADAAHPIQPFKEDQQLGSSVPDDQSAHPFSQKRGTKAAHREDL